MLALLRSPGSCTVSRMRGLRRSFIASVFALAACQGNRPVAGHDDGRGSAMPDSEVSPAPTLVDAAGDETATAPDVEAGTVSVWDAVVWRNAYLARRGQHGIVVGKVGGKFVPPASPAGLGPGLGPIPPGIAVGVSVGTASGQPASPAPPPNAGSASTLPVGPPPRSPADLLWLIDDSAGNGALGIRVQFNSAPPVAGERVAVAGAWMLDSARQWYWKAPIFMRWTSLSAIS